MAQRTFPGLGLRGGYNVGEDGWGTAATEDLRKLSALVQGKVLSRISGDLPDSPSEGDRYILLAQDSNSVGDAGYIVLYENGAWLSYQPDDGWQMWVVDEDKMYRYVSGSWLEVEEGAGGGISFSTFNADFTLDEDDDQTMFLGYDDSNSGVSLVVTIPNESSLDLPAGYTASFTQMEDGQIVLEGEQDSNSLTDVVLIIPADLDPETRAQFSVITILKTNVANTWIVYGDLDAV